MARRKPRTGPPRIHETETWQKYQAVKGTGKPSERILLGRLVQENEKLAYRFLNIFMGKWSQFGALPLEDMQQAARIGLLRALTSFDPKMGAFPSWVHLWTRREMGSAAETYGVRTRVLPVNATTYREIVDFEIRMGRMAEPSDLPHIPEKKLRDAQFKAHFLDIDEDSMTGEGEVHEHLVILMDIESFLDEKRAIETWDGAQRDWSAFSEDDDLT